MNPFEDLLTQDDLRLANESIRVATKQLNLPAGVWVCVGSRVVNLAHSKSDIDLLFFSEDLQSFQRLDTNLNGTRVSVCAAPMGYLYDDAHYGTYGGYFAAKIFNPRAILKGGTKADIEKIVSAPFRYFSPFLSFLCKSNGAIITTETLTALCVVMLINICPEYDAYFLKLCSSPNFEIIWKRLQMQLEASMHANGVTIHGGELLYRQQSNAPKGFNSYEDFYRERASRAANHWSFGVFTHNGNHEFYEHYKKASQQLIESRGGKTGAYYTKMIDFLQKKSSYPVLYL